MLGQRYMQGDLDPGTVLDLSCNHTANVFEQAVKVPK